MRVLRGSACLASVLAISSCVPLPNLPDDFSLPINEIIRHTACELRSSFRILSNRAEYPNFNARQWAASVALTPKVDAEIIGRAGLTRRSNLTSPKFQTWSIGNAPGASLSFRGRRDGSVSYVMSSRKLIDASDRQIDCSNWSASHHQLAQHLGVREWLLRTAAVANGDLHGLAQIDKPTYTTNIFIKLDGAGTFTYNFPLGTDFAGIAGNTSLEETLSITLTPDPDKVAAKSLPSEGRFGTSRPTAAAPVSPAAQYRLDQIQLEQILRNLQIRAQ